LLKKDENGNPRTWPKIEEEKIKEIFDTSKANVVVCLEEFKKVVYPKNVTEMVPDMNETPGGESLNFDQVMSKMSEGMKRRVSSIASGRILSEEEINRVRDKFFEEIDFVHEEAIARHVSSLLINTLF
jgi:hypothetical protein